MENIDNYILDEQTLAEHYKESGNTYGYESKSKLVEYLKELKTYKDAEEQGLLLRLPCPLGTKIYCIHNGFVEEGMFFEMSCFKFKDYYNKSWFLTKEAAEQALAEMKIH